MCLPCAPAQGEARQPPSPRGSGVARCERVVCRGRRGCRKAAGPFSALEVGLWSIYRLACGWLNGRAWPASAWGCRASPWAPSGGAERGLRRWSIGYVPVSAHGSLPHLFNAEQSLQVRFVLPATCVLIAVLQWCVSSPHSCRAVLPSRTSTTVLSSTGVIFIVSF